MRRTRLSGTGHDRLLWAGLGTAVALAAGGRIETADIPRLSRDPERKLLDSPPEGRAQTVRSADGTALHLEAFGPEDGDTVVLIHGWTEALQYWVYVIRAMSRRGFRVVAYDQRGHGESEPAHGGDYAIERFGEDLEAVLGTCVPRGHLAIVAGHSLGAMSIAA